MAAMSPLSSTENTVVPARRHSSRTSTARPVARRRATLVVVCIAAVAALAMVSASTAMAETGWWHLTSNARPAYFHAGAAHGDVQELVIKGRREALIELSVGKQEVGVFATEPFASEFLIPEPTAANVQAALEKAYGAGNVTVKEEDTAEEIKLIVTSTGADGDRPLGENELLKVESDTEVAAEAKVASPGRPDGEIYVTATNLGDAPIDGSKVPMQLKDVLPHGLRAVGIAGTELVEGDFLLRAPLSCSLASLTCTAVEPLVPNNQFEVRIAVMVEPGAATGELNTVSASGGEAFTCHEVAAGSGKYGTTGCVPRGVEGESLHNFERVPAGPVAPASAQHPITINSAPVPFGFEDYELTNEEEGGAPTTQAGAHPFQQTTTIVLNQTADTAPLETIEAKPRADAVGLPKDLHFKWPAGLIGNPSPIPRCAEKAFFHVIESGGATECPPDTAVGIAAVTVNEPTAARLVTIPVPLFNLPPRAGEPARLGFEVPLAGVAVLIDTAVRTGSDYGITVTVENITQTASFLSSEVTVWGVPGDPRHNKQRGWSCTLEAVGIKPYPTQQGGIGPCSSSEQHGEVHQPPFLSLPTACTGSLHTSVEGDSWANAGAFATLEGKTMPALDGCNLLPFSPSIKVTPDGTAASTPTGLNVDVHIPQEESLNPSGLAVAEPKNITVAVPPGVAINPAGGDGLEACPEALAGFTGFAEFPSAAHTTTFTETLPSPLLQGVNFCSNASKIGTVKIKTPILPNTIEGAVYLADQNQNPFGGLVAMYLIAEDPVSGVIIKLAGNVHLTEAGQIVATFENSPQAPFEDAELHFFGGERAPLATPAHCGAYTTTASIAPWTEGSPSDSSSTFDVTTGPHGAPCPGASLPFSPSLTGGTTNIDAGGLSPFVMTFGREDGNQDLQSIQLSMPPGMEGLLSTVKLCPEAQANEGTCGPASQIGETTVSAGVGGDPVSVTGGRVYITEGYEGAPYGLSIVNPVKAGPFDLEHDTSNPSNDPSCDCIVVRAKINVNPETAQLTITTDPSGPHAIPHLIDGIPVEIKRVNVSINRERFTFNPTSCAPQSVTGAIGSDEGAVEALSVPFQATNCAVLHFTPKLSVFTGGHTSKTDGASLLFKIAYPPNPMGTQAWFKEARFELPKQLPARLETLQKACLERVFDVNPAACPPGSLIGHAVVKTPVLPVPLTGPVYFVSHGGAKFPDAVVVLQGYGVTVDLRGETFINGKTGVTSATFATTPDVPFESLEVSIPSGPTSEFAANLPVSAHGSFCGRKLEMPTKFVAQNGLEINQTTPIAVQGCSTALSFTSSVNKRTLTLSVYAPAAGKLTASGKGLSTVSKTAKGQEIVTIALKQKKAGKFKTSVKVLFKPAKGKKQSKAAKLTFRK